MNHCEPNAIDLVLIREIERSGKTDLEISRATGDRVTKETIRNIRYGRNHPTTATLAILAAPDVFDLELRRKPKPRVKR